MRETIKQLETLEHLKIKAMIENNNRIAREKIKEVRINSLPFAEQLIKELGK